MSDNILAVNIPNLVSITILALAGLLLFNVAVKAFGRRGGGPQASQ